MSSIFRESPAPKKPSTKPQQNLGDHGMSSQASPPRRRLLIRSNLQDRRFCTYPLRSVTPV
jgi:hypothetical protein